MANVVRIMCSCLPSNNNLSDFVVGQRQRLLLDQHHPNLLMDTISNSKRKNDGFLLNSVRLKGECIKPL